MFSPVDRLYLEQACKQRWTSRRYLRWVLISLITTSFGCTPSPEQHARTVAQAALAAYVELDAAALLNLVSKQLQPQVEIAQLEEQLFREAARTRLPKIIDAYPLADNIVVVAELKFQRSNGDESSFSLPMELTAEGESYRIIRFEPIDRVVVEAKRQALANRYVADIALSQLRVVHSKGRCFIRGWLANQGDRPLDRVILRATFNNIEHVTANIMKMGQYNRQAIQPKDRIKLLVECSSIPKHWQRKFNVEIVDLYFWPQ